MKVKIIYKIIVIIVHRILKNFLPSFNLEPIN